jgi:predicted permease
VSGFAHEVLRRLEQFPEIRAAATVNTRPFLGWEIGAAVDIPGRPPRIPDENLNINSKVISPGYVAALGARLIRGRGFAQHDGWDSAGVVLINEAMARRFWPTENPLGKNIRARFLGSVFTAPWWPHQATDTFTIVGIVGDIKERRLSDRAEPVIYFSYLQTPSRYMHLLVRTTSTPTSIIGVVQREIRAVDPDLGVYGMQTMESVLGEAVAEPRLRSLLLWVFAAFALLLSAVGVYGVTAHTGAERTREFAVRMAIGASSSALFGMVTRDALGVTVTGIAIGLGGALLLGRVLSSLLYEVAPTDAAVLAGAAGVVLVVALVAPCVASHSDRSDDRVARRVSAPCGEFGFPRETRGLRMSDPSRVGREGRATRRTATKTDTDEASSLGRAIRRPLDDWVMPQCGSNHRSTLRRLNKAAGAADAPREPRPANRVASGSQGGSCDPSQTSDAGGTPAA